VLQGHVVLGVETQAGAEDVGHGGALLGQGVDDGGARRGHGSLEHVGQDGEHRVEVLPVGLGGILLVQTPLDAGHQLGDDHQVDDERGGEKGVLADVGDPGRG